MEGTAKCASYAEYRAIATAASPHPALKAMYFVEEASRDGG